MKINEYMKLLFEGKLQEAEQIRISTIPNKLIKFIWLDENERDEKKFKTLNNNEIWFSNKKFLNDPYEFKGMIVDSQKLRNAGYSQELIDAYKKLLDLENYGITCLSDNQIDYLPMWAYYTNNHKGFCVEYDICKKSCIHEVMYETERIKIASLFIQSKEALKKAILTGKRTEADIMAKILLQNLFVKAETWKHEKEYRIIYPIENKDGKNVCVNNLGMRISKIVAGINCSNTNIERLDKISNKFNLGNCYQSRLNEEKYSLDIYR